MADQISTYLVDDAYAPPTPRPELQQYDPYQTYDLICADTVYTGLQVSTTYIPPPSPILMRSFLAVDMYFPNRLIEPVNFAEIAASYP
jgi:hypothetical protein